MLLINCPYCGKREQEEFSCGGEAHIIRPKNPHDLTDDQWADYLFLRQNIKDCSMNDGIIHLDVENGLM